MREADLVGVRQFDEGKAMADALEVFWRQGLASTTMLDLAKATGIQRGSLYNAYGDKEEIFLRAFDLYAERFLSSARLSLEADDPETALTRFFAAAIANMTSGAPSRGCLTTKTAGDGTVVSPPIRERLTNLLDTLDALVAQALDRPPIRSRLVLSPEETAQIIVTFTRGLAVMERIYDADARLSDRAAALVKALVRSRR